MSVKIEKQENSKVVLEFTMKNEEFRKAVDAAFKKNAKYFKVPGFRNGKVPRAVVEKMYGEECLYESVIEDNVDKMYIEAVTENKLEVVSRPELDVKEIGKDKDFVFTVTVYVKPEATVKTYKGLEVTKFDTKVSKALKLLIELEDIFYDIDKFSLDNDQCYPEFEHFMLQIGGIRKDFTDCVDKDITLLDIK